MRCRAKAKNNEVIEVRQLTQKDIYEKNFSTKMRGFNPKEVDEFLDLIMHDYASFEEEIDELKRVNSELMNKIEQLSEGGAVPSSSESVAEKTVQSSSASTNFDILKRISNLERAVFGSKLEEKKEEKTDDEDDDSSFIEVIDMHE